MGYSLKVARPPGFPPLLLVRPKLKLFNKPSLNYSFLLAHVTM